MSYKEPVNSDGMTLEEWRKKKRKQEEQNLDVSLTENNVHEKEPRNIHGETLSEYRKRKNGTESIVTESNIPETEVFRTQGDAETYRKFLEYQNAAEAERKKAEEKKKAWEGTSVPKIQNRQIQTGVNPMHSQMSAGLSKPLNNRTDEEKIIRDNQEKREWMAENRAKRDEKYADILAKASEVVKAPDFEEKSKYEKSGRWFPDIDYEYVNNPEMTKVAITDNGGVTPQTRKGYEYVNDEERAIYNYIYSTEGKKKAKEYLEALNLEERMAEDTITWNKEYAKEKPVQASVTSVLSNLANAGQGFVESALGNATGYGIDINSYGNVQRRASNAIRETVAENIENPVGKFFYQTGMSMADSVTSQVAAAGLAMLGLPPAVGASAILASNAATDGIISAKERGVSDDQALMTGIVQGGAEWFFEKVSLGNLEALKETAPATFKELVKGVLKQGGIEGSEEVFTSIANAITDQIINKDLSELNLMKQYYISQGMSEEEAEKQVKKDFAKQIGMDFLGGFASGTTMSTAVSTFNYALNKMDEKASEKAGTLPEETETLPKESEMISEESEMISEESEMIPEEIEMEETEQIPWEEAQMYAGEPIGNTSEKGVAPAQKIEENQGILKGTEPKSEGEKIIDTVLENGNVSDNFADEIVKNDNLRKAFEAKTGITIRGNETEQRNTVKAVARSYAESHTGTVEQKKTAQNASVATPARQNATIKGKGVEIVGVETENGSELKFKDSSGNSYTISEVKFADRVAQKLYGAAAEIAMVSDSETANSFVQHYEASMPIQYYAIGFDRFYSLGKMGVPKATALKSLDFLVSNTSEEAMMNAWNLGNRSRENDRAKVEVKKEKQKRKGTGTYEDQTRNFNANAQLQTLVANRTGIDIKREAGTDENTNGYFIPSMMQMVISDKAANEYATLLHELGEFGLAYNKSDMKELQNMLLRYQAEQSGIKGVGETAALVKAYQQLYAEKEGNKTYEQAVDEMVNDALAGLFSSDEGVDQFVEWLQKDSGYSKAEQKSLVQQLMDLLEHIVKYLKTLVKEGRQSAAALKAAELEAARVEELRTKFLEVLEGAIETAHTTGEYESDTRVKYHVSDKLSEEIDDVLNGTMPSGSQVKARDFTPAILVQNKVKNLPMLITQKHVKTVIYTEAEAKSKGIKVKKGDNYHGLGKELFIKAIDNLDDPAEIYKTKDDTFLVVTELKDSKGDEIVVPIKIKAVGNYNGLFINENQIKSVYGRNQLRQYLQENHFKQIYKKKRTALKEGVQYSNLSDSSTNILAENNENATPEKKNSFAGVEATTADKSMLELANDMEQRGEDSETIRKHTGWHRGYDGKWRFEIDDSQMEILDIDSNYMNLPELMKHDKLFEAYPILKQVRVYFQNLDGYNGKFDSRFYAIDLDKKLINDPEKLKETLAHEIQHVIQYEEGFASGANTEYWQERIDNGYDSRPKSVRDEEWQLRKQYLEWQEEDPEFVADMEKLEKMTPNVPRGEFDFDTWEQISEDPVEWQQYDAERERLEEKYGEERVWDYSDWKYQTKRIQEEGRRTASELYHDTAGEIEARETSRRLTFDENSRKRYQPRNKRENLKRDNVVFAKANLIKAYMEAEDAELYKFVKDVLEGKTGKKARYTISESIPRDLEQKIGEIVGFSVEGYGNEIGKAYVEHIWKRHGANGSADNSMADIHNIAKIGYAIEHFEDVRMGNNKSAYWNEDHSPAKTIEIKTKIGDDYFYVVEAVPDTKIKKLRVVSAYISKKDTFSGMLMPNGLKRYVQDESQPNVSKNIISNSDKIASEDVKYSISTEDLEELQRQHENTLRENDIFRHMIDYLTRSIEATKGTAISEKSAEGVANRMIRRYKSEADKGKVAAEVQKLFKMMSEGKANKEDFLYFAEETIRPVVEQSKNNKQISDYAKGILSDIRKTPIKLGKLAKQEVAYHYGSYNDFRRKLFGRAQISNNGTDLDILWQQWSGIYPELFDAETVAEDQPVRLAEIIDALKEDYDSEVGYNLEEAVTYAAMELMEEYAKLPEVKALTAAQDMAQMQRNIRKLNEEYRQQYEQKLRELKGEHREKLARQEAKFRARMSQSRSSRLETQERKKYKDSIVKNTKEIMRWLEVNNDKYHVPEVLRETTIGFLGGMDFMTENGWNSQDTVMLQNRLNILYRKLSAESTMAEGDDVMADLDPDFLPTLDGLISLLEQSDEIKKIGDMDSVQLKDVAYLVGTLKRVITTANRLIANKQYQHVSQMGDSTVSFLAKLKAKKQQGKWATMGDELLNLHMLDSKSFFEEMGEAAGSLWQELRDGFNQRTWKLERAKKYMEEVVGDSKIAKWTGKKAETHSFEFNGQQFDITTGQLMTLYLLSKRPQAYNHLMAGATMYSETGGFTIDAQSVVKGQKIPERRIKVTDAQMKEMFKSLTPEQIRIAKAMQKFLAKDCAEWGNEVSMTMYGYKKFGEATYWPIKTNDNFNKTDDKNAESGAANTSLYAIRNQGMTKNLVKNASNPIVVGDVFEVFAEHVANMANYNAFVIPLSDAMKWFNYRSRSEEGAVTGSIKEEMERSYGKGAKRYFINFIKDINGEVKKGVASEISSTFTSKYKAAAVGANLRVVIQQPTAIFRAMSVMNPRYLAQGIVHGSAMKEMHENSAVSVWKSWGYFETGLGQSMKQVITGEGTVFERIVEGSMAGAGLADDLTWGVLWNAVKAEVQDKYKDIDTSSEEYIELVRKRFDEVIDQTQVVDTVLHRSQMMRSGDGVVKMASAFMAEPTKSYNLLHNAIRELNQNNNEENRRKVARRAVVYGFTAIATAALASVVDAFRDDDEEKEWAEKWIENWKANAIESINPISQIPYLKELSSLWQGFDSSRMDMAGVSTLVNAVKQAYKYINGESKKTLYGVTKGIIRGMSQVTGIPLYNALRDVESTIEQFTFAPFDEEQLTGKDVRIRLIRAMREGNEKQVQKYLSWYDEQYKQKLADGKTDQEAKSDLKKSITSQYKEIYQNSTTAEKIEIKKMLLKIRVNNQQLYKGYDWSSWDEK